MPPHVLLLFLPPPFFHYSHFSLNRWRHAPVSAVFTLAALNVIISNYACFQNERIQIHNTSPDYVPSSSWLYSLAFTQRYLWISVLLLLLRHEKEKSADNSDQHQVASHTQPGAGPGVCVGGLQTIAKDVIEGSNVLIEVCGEPGLPLWARAQPVSVIFKTRPGRTNDIAPGNRGHTLN